MCCDLPSASYKDSAVKDVLGGLLVGTLIGCLCGARMPALLFYKAVALRSTLINPPDHYMPEALPDLEFKVRLGRSSAESRAALFHPAVQLADQVSLILRSQI